MDLMEHLKKSARIMRKEKIEEARMRSEKIEAQYSDIKEVKDKMRTLTKEYYMSITPWSDDNKLMSEEEFFEKKQELREKLWKLLDKHDIPRDYAEPDEFCDMCDNCETNINKPGGCEYERRRLRNLKAYKVFKNSGISEKRRQETFETFNFDYYSEADLVEETERNQREQASKILKKSKEFCKAVESGDYNQVESLYIWGDVGVGKSFITFCVANRLINKGVPVLYRRYDRLISEIQRTYSQQNVATIEVLEKVFDIDVLILDDLGVEVPSRDSAVKLYQILEERATAGSPTIITSNYSLGQIGGRYNEDITGKRIVRRVAELCSIYKLEAKGDITLIKKGGS